MKTCIAIPSLASLLLDSIPEATHVAMHNDVVRRNIGGFPMRDFREAVDRVLHFEGNSKLSLHQREERRLTAGQRLPLAQRGCEN
jgi:hypothetical protein